MSNFSATLKTVLTDDGATVTVSSQTYNSNLRDGLKAQVPAGQTVQFAVAFPKDTIQVLVLKSDKAVTINTNAADATGGNSFAVGAGVGVGWTEDSPFTNPITHDVTTVYVINDGSAPANVELRVNYN